MFWLKINSQALGAALWHSSWAGLTGEHKHRVFPSQWQSLLASTGSLEENVLPLLQYCLSLRVKKVLMLCRYQAERVTFFNMWNDIFDRNGLKLLLTKTAHIAWLNLSIIHWSLSKIWHRNKASCCKLNPLQSSKSKSTTSDILCLALIFNLSNQRTTVLHTKNRLWVAKQYK